MSLWISPAEPLVEAGGYSIKVSGYSQFKSISGFFLISCFFSPLWLIALRDTKQHTAYASFNRIQFKIALSLGDYLSRKLAPIRVTLKLTGLQSGCRKWLIGLCARWFDAQSHLRSRDWKMFWKMASTFKKLLAKWLHETICQSNCCRGESVEEHVMKLLTQRWCFEGPAAPPLVITSRVRRKGLEVTSATSTDGGVR